MDTLSVPSELVHLNITERLLSAEALWDSVISEQEKLKITDERKKELDARFADFQASPDAGIAWTDLKQKQNKRS
jgi:putative addiction module component (TIGR02574 family)